MIGVYLVGGLVNAAVLVVKAFLLSRFVGDIYGRSLLVIFLFIAGGAYVGFAVGEGVSPMWALAELAHVVIFGAMGLLGLRGSPYWIAAGWALHPPLGRRSSLLWAWQIIRSGKLGDLVRQF